MSGQSHLLKSEGEEEIQREGAQYSGYKLFPTLWLNLESCKHEAD